jgi:glutathione S-transferase
MLTETDFKNQHAMFERSLAAFEQCVDTPFVPGELQEWIDAVDDALERLRESFEAQRIKVHSAEFADIAREDPELLQRIRLMHQEDRALGEEQNRIATTIEALEPRIRDVGADEAYLRRDCNRLADAARAFVSRVRKQEVTIRTWWVEAFMRDRGTVD